MTISSYCWVTGAFRDGSSFLCIAEALRSIDWGRRGLKPASEVNGLRLYQRSYELRIVLFAAYGLVVSDDAEFKSFCFN